MKIKDLIIDEWFDVDNDPDGPSFYITTDDVIDELNEIIPETVYDLLEVKVTNEQIEQAIERILEKRIKGNSYGIF